MWPANYVVAMHSVPLVQVHRENTQAVANVATVAVYYNRDAYYTLYL